MNDEPDLWIIIPNWDKFQHLNGDRTVPWIKEYVDQLHRDEYLSLAPTARALLHGIRLLYAPCARQLRTSSVRGALQMRAKREHWDALVQAGFIELSASRPSLAPARAHTRPRGEVEVEVEKKEKKRKKDQCPHCGIAVRPPTTMADHLYSAHDLEEQP